MTEHAEPGRWSEGETEIEGMVERGELEYVEPSSEHADLLMAQAEGHLDAAAPLVDVHPPSAFTLLYDAARKAMTALLAKQGLRPTRKGGHIAVQSAAEAQLVRSRHLIRRFRSLRTRRNESEYPSIDHPRSPATKPALASKTPSESLTLCAPCCATSDRSDEE